MIFCRLLIKYQLFQKVLAGIPSTFSKSSCRNTIRVSNSLDPDQAQHFVESDMLIFYLLLLSADNLYK